MVVVDQGALAQLAREPGRELLPVLNRSAAMLPLVVFFAFVPGLVALRHHVLDEVGAAWGLRGLAALQDIDGDVALENRQDALPADAEFLPPLGAWLIALSSEIFNSTSQMSLIIPSYFAFAGAVVMAWVLVSPAAGTRLAFLTALIMSVHGQMLLQSRNPAPGGLTLLLTLVVIWGFMRHQELQAGPVSFPLLFAGIGLGLCLLAGGMLAVATLMVLALPIPLDAIRNGRSQQERRSWSQRWSGGISLAVLSVTGFAAGGWWELMMASHHGTAFWATWLGLASSGADVGHMAESREGFSSTFTWAGSLLGLVLLGMWSVSRVVFEAFLPNKHSVSGSLMESDAPGNEPNGSADTSSQKYRSIGVLASWTICAAIVMMVDALSQSPPSLLDAAWQSFAAFPFAVWAALGVDQIIRRRFGVPVVVVLTLGTLATCAAASILQASPWWALPHVTAWVLTISVAGAILCIGWIAGRICANVDIRQRSTLAGCLALLAISHVIWGNVQIRSDVEARHEFCELSTQLRRLAAVSHLTLIADAHPSLRLRYMIASSCPNAGTTVLTPRATDETLEESTQTRNDVLNRGMSTRDASIVVTWGDPTIAQTRTRWRGMLSAPITEPVFFEGRAIRVFGLTPQLR